MFSIGLLYQQPDAHYNLGLALAAVGRPRQACEAMRNAIAMQPDFPRAEAALRKIERAMAKQVIASISADGR